MSRPGWETGPWRIPGSQTLVFLGLIDAAGRWLPYNGDVSQQNAVAALLLKLYYGEFEHTQ